MKNLIIKIILSLIIIFLGWKVVESVMTPVKFENEKERREGIVVQNLIDIRTVELVYKNINNSYLSNFDTLISFLKNGEIPVINIIPDPNDTTFTKTINDTTDFVNVADSLFGKRIGFYLDSLKYIPFSDGEIFTINAGRIEKGAVQVNVFEVSCLYKQFLKHLDDQLVLNSITAKEDIDLFPGLKVGSMIEPSTDGNWE
ncbi:MAG: hypothetical protein JEY97_11835 [Bacteroidales bacterium]|nr:hypothetical protein [Bacteroidales bacterium]